MTDVISSTGVWALIIKKIPTRIQPPILAMYYGAVEKIFLAGELHWGYLNVAHYDSAFKNLYLKGRGRRPRFRDRDHALHTLWLYKQGETAGMDPVALNALKSLDDDGELPDIEYRLRLITEEGDVCIEPHEYRAVHDITPYIEAIGNEYTLKHLGGNEDGDVFRQKLHYVRSRGIPLADAVGLLLGDIKTPGVCWLKPHPQLAEAMGMAE